MKSQSVWTAQHLAQEHWFSFLLMIWATLHLPKKILKCWNREDGLKGELSSFLKNVEALRCIKWLERCFVRQWGAQKGKVAEAVEAAWHVSCTYIIDGCSGFKQQSFPIEKTERKLEQHVWYSKKKKNRTKALLNVLMSSCLLISLKLWACRALEEDEGALHEKPDNPVCFEQLYLWCEGGTPP